MTVLAKLIVPSPVGALRIVATDHALVAILFPSHQGARRYTAREVTPGDHPLLDRAAHELDEYFRGARRAFSLPLAPDGTSFQRDVWRALAEIPFGAVRTYADVAASLGRPSASRAVGAANARNPLSIVVPCHRVIGTGGALTGYAGGVPTKRHLLAHERACCAEAG
jgi:methylated-DNA-[protein]-cysteine S-methyltransferase